jgi:hypothetical protein
MINAPQTQVDDYNFVIEPEDATPKHGTTIQAGWGAAQELLKPKKVSSKYATDFRVSETRQLVRFLEDAPIGSYQQHWLTGKTEGKRSYVCLGSDCPLCTIAGDKPRVRVMFNVLVLTDEEPNVQVLHATQTLAKLIEEQHLDPVRGPLTKYYWSISRQGTGTTTQYQLERVKATDLADDWKLDVADVEAAISQAVSYDSTVVYISPRDELLTIARALVNSPVA